MNKLSDQIDLFGTEARKLYRRGGPDTSEAAARSIDTTRLEAMVFSAIDKFGRNGCIQSDLLREFPYHAYSSITARFKALDEKGMIVRGPDRRPGKSRRMQKVMRSKRHAGS